MFSNSLKIRKGDTLSCKYPKHGRLNILKRHIGVVEDGGVQIVEGDVGEFAPGSGYADNFAPFANGIGGI